MKNTLRLIILAGFGWLCACIPLWWGEYDKPEPFIQDPAWLEYLEQVKAQPLDFEVSASEDASAWMRAQDILRKYGRHEDWCSSKLQASIPDIIEVDVQPGAEYTFKAVGFLFRIARTRRDDAVNYTITYAPVSTGTVYPNIRAHAQVIALYIVSGRFMEHVWSGQQFENRLRGDRVACLRGFEPPTFGSGGLRASVLPSVCVRFGTPSPRRRMRPRSRPEGFRAAG